MWTVTREMKAKTANAYISAISLTLAAASVSFARQSQAAGKADDAGCRSCVSQAASLFASNRLDESAAILRQWSPRCPRNAQLHLLFSTVLVRQGAKQIAEAEQEAALACTVQPDSQAAHLQYAMTLQAREKFGQAAAEYEIVSGLNPASYEAWSALADIYKRLRRDDEAKQASDKAAILEPTTQAVKLSVLQNLKRSGKLVLARKELKKLMQESENLPEFQQHLVNEALQLGAYDEAVAACNNVLKAYPGSKGVQKSLFIALFLKRQYADAIARADKILTGADKNAETLALRGICKMSAGNSKDAESDIKAALSLDAASGFCLLSDGFLKLRNGEFEAAEEALKAASDSDTRGTQGDKIPQSLAHLALSRLNRKQGLLAEAVQEAHAAGRDKRFQAQALALESRALLQDTSRADALNAASLLAQQACSADADEPEANLAQAYSSIRAGKLEDCGRLADKISQSGFLDADLHLLKAQLASAKQDFALQKSELEKGLLLANNDPELLYNLGILFIKENKAAEALPLLKQAQERRVKGAEICFALALCCEKTGDSSESLKYYKQSLQQGLSGDNSQQAKAAISRLESGK